jgi:hypothetical protein
VATTKIAPKGTFPEKLPERVLFDHPILQLFNHLKSETSPE